MACLILTLGLVSGCASFKGYPDRATERKGDLDNLETAIDGAAVLSCLQPGDGEQNCRNRLVSARMYAIDLQFSEFEEDLFRQTREAGFFATLATLGVTSAGALTGGGASNILSAIAAGLTGSRAAFEKEVLAEKTLLAIHTAMRANRTKVSIRLRQGLKRDIVQYPVGVALSDLESYYQGGTVLGALIGITESVGAEGKDAERALLAISGYSTAPASVYLKNYLFSQDLTDEVRQDRIRRVQEEYRLLNVDITRFLGDLVTDPNLEAETETVARKFDWPG